MAPAAKRRRVISFSNAAATSSYSSSTSVSSNRNISSYGRIGKAAHLVGVSKEDATKKKLQLTEADANALNRISQSNLLNGKTVASQVQQHGGTNLKRKTSSSSEEGNSSRKAFKTQTGGRLVPVDTDAVAAADDNSEGENASPALPTIAELPAGTDSPRTKAARRGLAAFTIKSSPTKPRASRDTVVAVKQEELQPSSPSSLSASNTLQQSSSSPSLPTPCPRKRRREGVAEPNDDGDDALPQSVQEFVDLHTSFLTALSLHYAHNGTAVPVDVGRQLGPSVSRIWGRRAINVDDVRRLLGVQQRAVGDPAQAALLSVWDYGKGKTCLEYCAAIAPNSSPSFPPAAKKEEDESNVGVKQERTIQKRPMMKKAWSTGNIIGRQPLDSSSISRSFGAWIREHFAAWVVNEGFNADVEEFIKSLPLARLHRRAASRAAKSTLLSKGQTRLTELRVGAVARQARDTKDITATASASSAAQQQQSLNGSPTGAVSAPVSASTTPLERSPSKVQTAPSQRSTSLRDRIRAKESLLASQPSGPSPEQLARRAALQRLPDIMGVLSVLASNSGPSMSSHSPSALGSSTANYASLLTARSGITPTPRTTTAVMHSSPLTQRLSGVTLSGLGGNSGSSDDALLAALGGGSSSSSGSVKSSSSNSFMINNNMGGLSRSGSMSSTGSRGLEGMFGPNVMQQSNLGAMSMSMGQVVERVQNSMRSPMSRVEIELVLRLIADEVAPEWLTVKKVGSVSAVSFRPSGPMRAWKDRVEELIAAC